MSERLHLCDLTLNETRASVFQVAHQDTIRHEVELWTNEADSDRVPEQPLRKDLPKTLRDMAFESARDIDGVHSFFEDFRPHLVEGSEFATDLETSTNGAVADGVDFITVCHTTANLIEHLERGRSLDSFITAHCSKPGNIPEIKRPAHEHEEDHEISR